MIKGIFIFLAIMIAGSALAAGEILGAVVGFIILVLSGIKIDKLVSNKIENRTNKEKISETKTNEISESVISDSIGEKLEDNSEIIDSKPLVENELNNWKCPECGNINSGKFCEECGTKKDISQDKFCKNCGIKLNENQKFCEECGTKV